MQSTEGATIYNVSINNCRKEHQEEERGPLSNRQRAGRRSAEFSSSFFHSEQPPHHEAAASMSSFAADQVVSFLAYSFVIYPMANYLVSGERKYGPYKRALYSICFLALVSSFHLVRASCGVIVR
jgi:hypothetical protein